MAPRRASAAVIICLAVVGAGACRQGVPLLDTGPDPARADGTISGTVRVQKGGDPLANRIVEVLNVDTAERMRTTTGRAGGFTFKVRPGQYRLGLILRDGEILVRRPGVITVDRSDVDAHADLEVGVSRATRPRPPVQRGDDGLGAPSA